MSDELFQTELTPIGNVIKPTRKVDFIKRNIKALRKKRILIVNGVSYCEVKIIVHFSREDYKKKQKLITKYKLCLYYDNDFSYASEFLKLSELRYWLAIAEVEK